MIHCHGKSPFLPSLNSCVARLFHLFAAFYSIRLFNDSILTPYYHPTPPAVTCSRPQPLWRAYFGLAKPQNRLDCSRVTRYAHSSSLLLFLQSLYFLTIFLHHNSSASCLEIFVLCAILYTIGQNCQANRPDAARCKHTVLLHSCHHPSDRFFDAILTFATIDICRLARARDLKGSVDKFAPISCVSPHSVPEY